MSVEHFLDTNLFIYQIETENEAKADVANRIIRAGIETGNACISFQVVQECLNTIVRKAQICLTKEQTVQYLDASLRNVHGITSSTGAGLLFVFKAQQWAM
jgi:predicted nucleic acid-binding protein